MFKTLGADHCSWLLAAADTFLQQQMTDRAIVLLEFLGLLDPRNIHGQKMLAYALLLQDDLLRCRATLARLSGQQLTGQDRAAVEMMNARLEVGGPEQQPRLAGA